MPDPIQALRALALRHPGVTEGVACAGTAMERRTLKTHDRAFLFLGPTDALVKLEASIAEATRLEAKEPERYRVGANGWVKATFSADAPPALDVLGAWIEESYRLISNASPSKRAPPKKKKKPRTTPGYKR